MNSKRLKSDARAHMAQNPGVSYQEALRVVAGAGIGAAASVATTTNLPGFSLCDALGIGDIAVHDFRARWASHAGANRLRIPIARYRDGVELSERICDIELGAAESHVVVVGRTGSGKSSVTRGMIAALAAEFDPGTVNVALFCAKDPSPFHGFDALPHTVISISERLSENRLAEQVAGLLDDELARRETLIADAGCKDIGQYRVQHQRQGRGIDPGRPALPYLAVVLEEFGETLTTHPELTRSLALAARTGPDLGVFLLLSDQHIDSPTMGLLDRPSAVLALNLTSPGHSMTAVGTAAAADSRAMSQKGAGFLRRREDADALPVVTFNPDVPDAPLDDLIERLAEFSDARVTEPWTFPDRAELIAQVSKQIVNSASTSIQNLMRAPLSAAKAKAELGLPGDPHRWNSVVIAGPAGVGKSYMATALARVMYAAGDLQSSNVVTVSRADLVGTFEGETAIKTAAAVRPATGGVLCIDNAGNLVQDRGNGRDVFGEEAAGALANVMDSLGEQLTVFVIGEAEGVQRLLKAVPGLAGRFPTQFVIPSSTADELWQQLLREANEIGCAIAASGELEFKELVTPLCAPSGASGRPRIDLLGNLRFARNVADAATSEASIRLAVGSAGLDELRGGELMTLTAADIVAAVRRVAVDVDGVAD